MDKEDFLKTVSSFSREEFRQYLFKHSDKKQKLIECVKLVKKENDHGKDQ